MIRRLTENEILFLADSIYGGKVSAMREIYLYAIKGANKVGDFSQAKLLEDAVKTIDSIIERKQKENENEND